MEATYKPIERGMGKEGVVRIYNGILFSHKKNKILPFTVTWMYLRYYHTD